jgi:hypothetical protein
MQKLLEPNTVPPGGFRFFQPETRTWITAADYRNLFVNVRDHRKANNLPLDPLWEEKVEDSLCRQLPPGLCKETGKPGQHPRNVFNLITWDQVYNGTITLASWAQMGFSKVDQELATKRGDICSRCYLNVSIGGLCGSCRHLQDLAAAFTQGRVTAADHYLKACAVCKCSLRVKVWTPIDAISDGTPDSQLPDYPEWCWIPNELVEYKNAPRRTSEAK